LNSFTRRDCTSIDWLGKLFSCAGHVFWAGYPHFKSLDDSVALKAFFPLLILGAVVNRPRICRAVFDILLLFLKTFKTIQISIMEISDIEYLPLFGIDQIFELTPEMLYRKNFRLVISKSGCHAHST